MNFGRVFLLLLIAATASAAPPATPQIIGLNEAIRKDVFLYVAIPAYPKDARVFRPVSGSIMNYRPPTGRGVYDVTFDYDTGRVRAIHILKSTGSSRLDGCAIAGLKIWKVRPHTVRTVRVPITFKVNV